MADAPGAGRIRGPMAFVLYRVVPNEVPAREDFQSDRLSGHRMRRPDETDEEWDSFSAFRSRSKVRQVAPLLRARRRTVGALYIARLDVPDGVGVQVFPYRGSSGHFGVRGSPEVIVGFATIVERVE